MNHRLPSDLWRKIIKDWIYPEILFELIHFHHKKRLKAVLKELIDEFFNGYPRMFENWFITNDGVFLMPEPGFFDRGRLYFVRLDPEDSVRYGARHRDFFFEIQPTRETLKVMDDFRRNTKPFLSPRLNIEAFHRLPKYYTVSVDLNGTKTAFFTFEKNDLSVIDTIDDVKFIRLPSMFKTL